MYHHRLGKRPGASNHQETVDLDWLAGVARKYVYTQGWKLPTVWANSNTKAAQDTHILPPQVPQCLPKLIGF